MPHSSRSREWLRVALIECARCQQVVERRSPVRQHCPDCAGKPAANDSVREPTCEGPVAGFGAGRAKPIGLTVPES